jgi:hypothetical protein
MHPAPHPGDSRRPRRKSRRAFRSSSTEVASRSNSGVAGCGLTSFTLGEPSRGKFRTHRQARDLGTRLLSSKPDVVGAL